MEVSLYFGGLHDFVHMSMQGMLNGAEQYLVHVMSILRICEVAVFQRSRSFIRAFTGCILDLSPILMDLSW